MSGMFKPTAAEIKLAELVAASFGDEEVTVPRDMVMQVLAVNVVMRGRLEDLIDVCKTAGDIVSTDIVMKRVGGAR